MQAIIEERELIHHEKQQTPCDEKLDRLAWVSQSSYEIGDFRFGVRTTSERFSAWIDNALSRYRVDDIEDPLYSIVVGNGADGAEARGKREYHIMYTGVWPTVRTFQLASLGYGFLSELETHLFPTRSDLIFVDAIAIAVNDKVALLPGSSLPSLARLGRRARKYGLSLSPSMAAAIDPDTGRAMPLPMQLLNTSDVSRALDDLGSLASVNDLFVITEPFEVDVIGTWDTRRGRSFEPMSRAETLHHLAGKVFNYDAMGSKSLTGLGRLVERADCYGLVPQDPEHVAEWLSTIR